MKRPWWIRPVTSVVLFQVGFAGWMFAGAVVFGFLDIPPDTELPLGWPTGIAVDPHGRVYCGAQAYGRIQVYDRDGRFLRGWSVDAGAGLFRMRTDAKGRLEVATARNNMRYVYDAQGTILEEEERTPGYFRQFGARQPDVDHDGKGSRYKLRTPWVFPRVTRRDSSGGTSTVVSPPLHLWPIMAPFPAFLWCLVAVISLLTHKHVLSWFGRKVGSCKAGREGSSSD